MALRLTEIAFRKVISEYLDDLMNLNITINDLVDIVRAKGVPEAIVRKVAELSFVAVEDDGDNKAYWSRGLNIYYQGRVFRVVAIQTDAMSDRDIVRVSYRNEDIIYTIADLNSALWTSSYILSHSSVGELNLPEIVHGAVIEFMKHHKIRPDQNQPVIQDHPTLQESQALQELQSPQFTVSVDEYVDDEEYMSMHRLNVSYKDKMFRIVGIPGQQGRPGRIEYIQYWNKDMSFYIDDIESLRKSNYVSPNLGTYDRIELTIPENVHQIIIDFMDRYGIERPLPVSKPKGPKQTKTSILRATKAQSARPARKY